MRKSTSQEINLTIYIDEINGSWQIMATNEKSESIAYGIEHAFDEALNEQFLPELRRYLMASQDVNSKLMKLFNIDGFSDDGTHIIRDKKKSQ